jgi:large subunit ribosomal protein L34e
MTAKDNRVTYRRRHSYRTRSNKVQKVKTPGGKVTVHYATKKAKGVLCGDCKKSLNGIPRLRPHTYSRISRSERTISRAYGGSRCAECTRSRIMRAFIIEEQRIVKKVLLESQKAATATKA